MSSLTDYLNSWESSRVVVYLEEPDEQSDGLVQ